MKRIISVLLLLVVFSQAFSLTSDDTDFLKSLESFSGTSLVGSYSQVKGVSGSTRTLTTSGQVIISPDDGIAWIAEKPYVSKLVVAKDHLTQQIRNNKPTKLEVAGNEIYTQIATALECVFFGDFETMQSVFNADFDKKEEGWILKLSPKAKSLTSFINRIEITGDANISILCLYEATGDKIVYNFSDLVSRELTSEEKAVYSL